MKTIQITLLAAAAALFVAGDAEARGRNPGSKLIYPVHRSGPSYFTVISVTNINTQPANQVQLGGTTFVHFEYYNTVPDDEDPCLTKSCNIHNDTEILTPADTLSLLTTCHNAEGPQGNEGFLVITAQNPSVFDLDWQFDYLVGSELVVNSSGGVYSLNAVPLKAVVDDQGPKDDLVEGALMGGVWYEPLPYQLIADSFLGKARSQLSLISFMDDPNDHTLLYFQAWNDNEQPMSATKWMGCWFDRRLDQVAPMFGEAHLLGTGHDPAEVDLNCNGIGQVETGWFTVGALRVETPAGDLVPTKGVPLLGAITSGVSTSIDGGRLLWEVSPLSF